MLLPVHPDARRHIHQRQRLSLAQSELQEMRGLAQILLGNDDVNQ